MLFDSNGWLDVATEIDILENSFDRQGHQPRFIILHGTAGGTSAIDVANYMKGTVGSSNPVSTHFVIGQDGTIVQCVPLSLAAWGNGVITGTPTAGLGFRTAGDEVHRDDWWNENVNPNYLTVSVEHCKPHDDNSDTLTPAQQAASFALVQCICDTYGIPKRFADAQGGIIGHFSIDVANRSLCPNTYPWQDLFNYLANGGNTMAAPQGWTDNGQAGVLTAPNGIPVVLGFRDHVLDPKNNWDPNDWPLEPEQHFLVLEQSNTSLGAGQGQTFRLKRLEYTPKMGVFEGWIGQELIWHQKQCAQLQSQIADLQSQIATLQQSTLAQELQKEQNKLMQIGQIVNS